jgi:hypothetical protein
MCDKFGFQFRDLIYNWAKDFDHWLKIIDKKYKSQPYWTGFSKN